MTLKNPSLIDHDTSVRLLRGFMSSGLGAADEVPKLVKDICHRERWRKRVDEQTGQVWECATFLEFVTEPPLKGLGSKLETLKALCRDDPEALDALDQAMQQKHGGDRSKRDNITLDGNKRGTSRDGALRRLRKDRPDLHAKVLAKEMSANAAMIEAGFRKVKKPAEQIKTLWPKLSRKERRELLTWLQEQEG